MMPKWRYALAAAVLLGLFHLGLQLLPSPPLGTASNLVLYAVNLYVLYCGWVVLRTGGRRELGWFATGYFAMMVIVLGMLGRESLFMLLVIAYASVFRVRLLLGLFVAFFLGYVIFQPYAAESFVLLALAWVVLYQLGRRGHGRFWLACAVLGLLALGLVLLPVVHLMMADRPQSLFVLVRSDETQRALVNSLSTATLSTLIVTLWGVPLGYALARTSFRGKAVVEALVDLPILVPQSVVGIALLVLLGPNTPIGQVLDGLGIRAGGTMLGIVLAQVFVASPFLVKSAYTAFLGVPRHLEDASRTLGASAGATFFCVSLPLAGRGIFAGMLLCWSRAISEFGAILLLAPHPTTAPVLAHDVFLRAGASEARPVASLLLWVCVWVFVLLQFGKEMLPFGGRRETAS